MQISQFKTLPIFSWKEMEIIVEHSQQTKIHKKYSDSVKQSQKTQDCIHTIATISAPICSSRSSIEFFMEGIRSKRWTYVAPPPGTIPSFMAAKVAFLASSILSFLSSSSISVCAPTYTIGICIKQYTMQSKK